MYYTVVSSSNEYYDAIEKLILEKIPADIIIKEYGKNGTHPHLNIVWNSNIKRTCDVNRKVYSILDTAKIPRSLNLVRTKTITNLSTLLVYMTKEANYEILKDSKKYDLNEMLKEQKIEKFRETYWIQILGFIESPYVILKYCEKYNIPLAYPIGLETIKVVFRHMTKIGKICVIHLYRREEDIIRCINDILSPNDEIFDLKG